MQMRGKPVAVTQASTKALKPKKEKVSWTRESALNYITKNSKAPFKGLKFWAAFDYLKKVDPSLVSDPESYNQKK